MALNIETGVQGYLLTPYHQSVTDLDKLILHAQSVSDPSGPHAEQLSTLYGLLKQCVSISEDLIRSPLHGEDFTEKLSAGKVTMDGIRQIVQTITREKL